MSMPNKKMKTIIKASAALLTVLTMSSATAGIQEQAKRIHDRITGVPPTADELTALITAMGDADEGSQGRAAALAVSLENKNFYNVTLKNMYTPWSNEEQTVFAPLNDFTATMIGVVRDELDFRRVLYDDILYVGTSGTLSPNSNDNNDHYADIESQGIDMSDEDEFERVAQSSVTALPSNATSGVLTTRAAAKAFFVAGTNRAMFRFTTLNFLCNDVEQLKDTTRATHRIRQDVTRSPGGDSRIYMNACMGCHAGMDPLAQAYAYYNWSETEASETGHLEYTPGSVQPKYLINATNFPYGYITPNDRWTNYWREGPNAWLGWDSALSGGGDNTTPTEGNGAKTMNQELAHTDVFAQCQVKKVFTTICLREPATEEDFTEMKNLVSNFQGSYNHNLKLVFADAAEYCKGP